MCWDLVTVVLAFLLHSLDTLLPLHYGAGLYPLILPVLYPLTQVRLASNSLKTRCPFVRPAVRKNHLRAEGP